MIREILVAEDERGTSLLLKSQLERSGYTVTVASNGVEALELLMRRPFDLLITDVVMPEMDGIDLYRELKKHRRTEKIPVIIISDKQMFKVAFYSLGTDSFVAKSGDVSLLLSRIQAVSEQQPGARIFHKILVAGAQTVIVDQIKKAFKSGDRVVVAVDSIADLAAKVFLMNPHVILIDAGLRGAASPSELVSAFRSFRFLRNSRILTYAQPVADDPAAQAALDAEVAACLKAGADRHLGPFDQALFQEVLSSLCPS
ncbi:MAG: response regulator [Candidatus Omnitrophota bacterium]